MMLTPFSYAPLPHPGRGSAGDRPTIATVTTALGNESKRTDIDKHAQRTAAAWAPQNSAMAVAFIARFG